MAQSQTALAERPVRSPEGSPPVHATAVLSALADAIVVVDGDDIIRYVNPAGEQLFQASAPQLQGQPLGQVILPDHPLFGLLRKVREGGFSLAEHGVNLESPRFSAQAVTVQLAPIRDEDAAEAAAGDVVIAIHQPTIAHRIDQQLTHRNAARSVAGMAAILAHEVKNPLAGIRGAAQLIEEGLPPAERELTRLICDEADRICALVDRMDVFSDQRPTQRRPVNIHEVLEHVRRVAQTSFGRHLRFQEVYDPSLPPVLGNRDRLIQVFMNLVRNAADAVPAEGGEIVLSTAYRHGVRLAVNSTGERVSLPLVVSVQDNGSGIPEDLAQHLFDPFVTTKPDGHGLGLALVAKIVDEHGGVIEFDSEPRKTVFRVMLPVCSEQEAEWHE
jgi:two-component system nitrogen regulation sensor histidine kinase GlnL